MLPVIVLVGRPNVGKSTLFNYLTRSRDALVADYPGLTRDRQYGRVKRGERDCLIIDTGGLCEQAQGIEALAAQQVQQALEEADLVFFLLDTRAGLHPSDQAIAIQLRKTGKPVILVANKIDGLDVNAAAEFHALGMGTPFPITATHGRGVAALLEHTDTVLPAEPQTSLSAEAQGIRIAVVGRPNVGKSTLINRLLGEDRVVVFDQPGTTRDSVLIPFQRNDKDFTLIDTAGIRRRSKVTEAIEKFSIIKAMQAIEQAHVVIYVIDASEGVTEQDATLLGMVLEAGKSLVIALNKWDGLSTEQRDLVRRHIEVKLLFLEFAEKHFISALHGTGVGNLFDVVQEIYEHAMIDMSTSALSVMLTQALKAHQPPLVHGRRIKLKYAHQGGHNPPTIVIHGNQTAKVPGTYKRYLMNFFRDKLKLTGTPVRLQFRSSDNPFKDQPNPLSASQAHKRKRMIRNKKRH